MNLILILITLITIIFQKDFQQVELGIEEFQIGTNQITGDSRNFRDDTVIGQSRNTRVVPNRTYEITPENAWDQIMSTNLGARSTTNLATYPNE
jgi:hypothetical protein